MPCNLSHFSGSPIDFVQRRTACCLFFRIHLRRLKQNFPRIGAKKTNRLLAQMAFDEILNYDKGV